MAQHRWQLGRVHQAVVVPAGQVAVRGGVGAGGRGGIPQGVDRGAGCLRFSGGAVAGPGPGVVLQLLIGERCRCRECRGGLGGDQGTGTGKQIPLQAQAGHQRQLLFGTGRHNTGDRGIPA